MAAETPPPIDVLSDEPPRGVVTFLKDFTAGLKKNLLTYVMFVVLVMSLAAILVAIKGIAASNEANTHLRKLVECQNSYNTVNNERTRQLSEAAARENIAETKADVALLNLVVVLTSKPTQTQMEDALRSLRVRLSEQEDARSATAQERLEHPVPPPPHALCGGL